MDLGGKTHPLEQNLDSLSAALVRMHGGYRGSPDLLSLCGCLVGAGGSCSPRARPSRVPAAGASPGTPEHFPAPPGHCLAGWQRRGGPRSSSGRGHRAGARPFPSWVHS